MSPSILTVTPVENNFLQAFISPAFLISLSSLPSVPIHSNSRCMIGDMIQNGYLIDILIFPASIHLPVDPHRKWKCTSAQKWPVDWRVGATKLLSQRMSSVTNTYLSTSFTPISTRIMDYSGIERRILLQVVKLSCTLWEGYTVILYNCISDWYRMAVNKMELKRMLEHGQSSRQSLVR